MNILKQCIRPEFLNRIDETIMFRPLDKEDVKKILRLQISQIDAVLKEAGIEITFSDDALNYLAQEGYNPAYGARPIKRVLQREVVNVIATKIISGETSIECKIMVGFKDGGLVFNISSHNSCDNSTN